MLFTACTDNSNVIIGKWKLENIDYSSYFAEISEELKMLFETQMEEEFNRLKEKTFFEFKEDQALVLEAPNYHDKQTFTNGNWKMNATKDSLFLELADPESYQIITLNDSVLVLKTDEAPKRTLKLIRNNR